MVDIVNAFAERFDTVALIAGSLRVWHIPLDGKVECSRIIKYNRNSLASKAFSWFWGTVQILFLLLFKYRKYDIFYTTNPPMACFLSYFLKRSFFICIFDVYPDALKTIGIGEDHFIYRFWIKLNKKVFSKAHKISTLSKGMADLLSKYVPNDKIAIIPNWADDNFFKPIEKKSNKFILENKLLDKFIVLYAGNIGHAHNIEVLIETARQLRSQDDVVFLIAGKGEMTQKIKQMFEDYNLVNCRMIPFQSVDSVSSLLGAADIGFIALNEVAALVSFPSRTYALMAVGAPLLCIVPEASELNRLVSKYKNGECFAKENIGGIIDFIMRLKSDKALYAEYKTNSVRASRDFTRENAKWYLSYYV